MYDKDIARKGLTIRAMIVRPEHPFTWASGYRMPMYNDNRMFLFHPEYRTLIAEGLRHLLRTKHIGYDIIAGTATAGIPPATTLADLVTRPLIYVRSKPKSHGLCNHIEGIAAHSDVKGMLCCITPRQIT